MADDAAPPSSKTSDHDQLYDACSKVALDSEEKFRKVFDQHELLKLCKDADLPKILDIGMLMPVIQALGDRNLFITLQGRGSSLRWRLRPRDVARKMLKMSNEQKMVYRAVEEAYTEGIWIRNIKRQCNLTDQSVQKAVDHLVKASPTPLIKNVKNIRAPAQKTYMLYSLAPSEDVTGGSFFDNGELDEGLVLVLSNLIVLRVRQESWVHERRKKPKREQAGAIVIEDTDQTRATSPEETRGRKKRKTSHTHDIEDAGKHREKLVDVQLSYPSGHKYPTVTDLHHWLTTEDFLTASKRDSLNVDEVQNIINILVWDSKLEKMPHGYRCVRGVPAPQQGRGEYVPEVGTREYMEDDSRRGNGLTEMPCGRCPVMNLCGRGGPINAESCVYFERWIKHAIEAPDGTLKQGLEIKTAG